MGEFNQITYNIYTSQYIFEINSNNYVPLLRENKLIICAFGNLHYIIQEKNLNLIQATEPGSLMVERQARDLEVRVSSPGSGSNFSLEI